MKGGEAIWGKKSSLKGMRGSLNQSNMKKKLAFRAPNIRFSIRRAYKNCKKKIPSFALASNLLTWRNLFFLGSDLKA